MLTAATKLFRRSQSDLDRGGEADESHPVLGPGSSGSSRGKLFAAFFRSVDLRALRHRTGPVEDHHDLHFLLLGHALGAMTGIVVTPKSWASTAVALTLPVTLTLSGADQLGVEPDLARPRAGRADVAGLEILPAELLGQGLRVHVGVRDVLRPHERRGIDPLGQFRPHEVPSARLDPSAVNPRRTSSIRAKMTMNAPRSSKNLFSLPHSQLPFIDAMASCPLEHGSAADQQTPGRPAG